MSTWTRAWKGNGSTVNTEAMHELGRTRYMNTGFMKYRSRIRNKKIQKDS
ncbi:hypothetical protein HanXRQr2_Chr17g0810631 [Helianthus annuus]|uniref:Uncharacterized protein n=1 Tax=Helianthus annuus TaxID=4232 RepID=A0A9K3GVU0_HELAN|nr:hypothetical protein HanXRQr2_Chr17g0810631 [Helianthus annuus]